MEVSNLDVTHPIMAHIYLETDDYDEGVKVRFRDSRI